MQNRLSSEAGGTWLRSRARSPSPQLPPGLPVPSTSGATVGLGSGAVNRAGAVLFLKLSALHHLPHPRPSLSGHPLSPFRWWWGAGGGGLELLAC